MPRTPVYFLSHGGPKIIEDTSHPAHAQLQCLGREITTQVRPTAVVVFSAHWQPAPDTIALNSAAATPLIYDFYGFPAHYYSRQYPNRGSPELAQRLLHTLEDAGIKAQGVTRGLDHGVWASFLCAFAPGANALGVPIVQVSLFDSEDARRHYALGAAVGALRDEGVLVVVSGMAVHNLRDMGTWRGREGAAPYTTTFAEALRGAVERAPGERREAMVALLDRPDTRKAHPSLEHLMPIFVGAGAAGEDWGKRVWTLDEGSLSWGMYRFGQVGA